MKGKKLVFNILKYVILCIGVAFIFMPLYLTIINAFKTSPESAKSFFSLPKSLFLGNFVTVIHKANYITFAMNSFLITGISLAIISIFIPIVSYSIARNMDDKKYYKFLYYFIIIGLFIPYQVKMMPIIKLMNSIHMMSKTGLIILYLSGALTDGVFLMVSYIKTVPYSIEESAAIDGANVWQIFRKIIYPLVKPMTATVLIIDGLWIWNDFFQPLLILNGNKMNWTLPLFQYNFKSQYTVDYNLAFASYSLAIVPIIILYVFIQKFVINGLTGGAVKN